MDAPREGRRKTKRTALALGVVVVLVAVAVIRARVESPARAPSGPPRFLRAHELEAVRVGMDRADVLVAFGEPWACVRRHAGFESWYYDAAKAPTGGEVVLEIVFEDGGPVVAIERLVAQPES